MLEPAEDPAHVRADVDEDYSLAPGPEAVAQGPEPLDCGEVHVGQVGAVDDDRGRRVAQRLLGEGVADGLDAREVERAVGADDDELPVAG